MHYAELALSRKARFSQKKITSLEMAELETGLSSVIDLPWPDKERTIVNELNGHLHDNRGRGADTAIGIFLHAMIIIVMIT